jgi:hypothetical protein
MRGLVLVVGSASVAISIQPAFALGECAKFGRPSYTADRTVDIGGQTIRSKVFVTPQVEREELTVSGRQEVHLSTGRSQTTYNLETNTGIVQTAPAPPPKPAKDKVRIREEDQGGSKVLTLELIDDQGNWRQIGQTTCRPDGAVLAKTFILTLPGSSDIVTGRMTQNITATGPLDPGLFKVPAQVKIKR